MLLDATIVETFCVREPWEIIFSHSPSIRSGAFISTHPLCPSSRYAHAQAATGDFPEFYNISNFYIGFFWFYYKQIERSRTLCPPCASAPDFFKISHISLNLSKLKNFFNFLAEDSLRTHHFSIDVPTSRVISATTSCAVNVLLESDAPVKRRNDRLSMISDGTDGQFTPSGRSVRPIDPPIADVMNDLLFYGSFSHRIPDSN